MKIFLILTAVAACISAEQNFVTFKDINSLPSADGVGAGKSKIIIFPRIFLMRVESDDFSHATAVDLTIERGVWSSSKMRKIYFQ